MGCAYVLVAIIIVLLNIDMIPSVFQRIFSEAFNFKAIFGGFGGSCIMHGVKRGLFSNEAGIGSAPNASASAEVSHPVKQGLVQILSVFIDTILICSATAFLCMCSGVENSADVAGAQYVLLSVKQTLGAFGPFFITMAMVLFAFTTLLGNIYYVDKGINYLAGGEIKKLWHRVIYVVLSLAIFAGATFDADLLWNMADITMGAMTLINMPVIFIMSKYVFRATEDFNRQLKEGKNPVFKSKDIGIKEELDYWR